ncbi:MAG TPA: hypothetical protein VJV77_07405 [Casimicrobiaceae bacterium]|nr:hypothetical protein [Casimicrobiaceae bacterium]
MSPLASVDVYDRTNGTVLAVYEKDGRRYVIGAPGHEYEIRIRNRTGERILAVTSVDGVNVVSGETASPAQSGYVIDAGGSVEIAGWRLSLERTAAFYFTDLRDSYAGRTGRPNDVGVIGVAVFRERPRANPLSSLRDKIAAQGDAHRERGDVPASPGLTEQPQADASAADAGEPSRSARQEAAAAGGATEAKRFAAAPKLGTGFGRDETSYAQHVRFDRASTSPVETIAIQYDRRDNLIAMGVLTQPRYAQRPPDPFPAMQFVPAPR